MKFFVLFLTLCGILTYSFVTAVPAVNPKCLVKAICASNAPPVYGSNDGGRTCKSYGNICFFNDEWCRNDYDGLPELKEISSENCQSIL